MAKKPARPAKTPALRPRAEDLLRTTKHDVAAMPIKGGKNLASVMMQKLLNGVVQAAGAASL